jgi:hypothetical protein
MKPLAELVEFCRTRGTPKLQAADPAALAAYLAKALKNGHVVRVAGEDGHTRALGVAWPCNPAAPLEALASSPCLYVANLCASDPASLRSLMEAAHQRWPQLRAFLADRVPKAQRQDPAASGQPWIYGPRQSRLLYRLAHR